MPQNYNIGVMFRCYNAPEILINYVQRAETAGFDEVWIVEDCFFAGGIASVATVLAKTETIRVGLGIMPAVVRNPAFAAMEIALLARLYPGRILPGFGHGVGEWMKQVGAFPPSQLKALEEVTFTVRLLLAGHQVNFHGQYIQLNNVRLDFPPRQAPPVSLGVRGPKSLQLSGKVADGTILAEHASAAYVRWAREQIDIGRRANGRLKDPHRLTVYTFCVVNPDRQKAYQTLRPLIAQALVSGNLTTYTEPLGITAEVNRLTAEGGAPLIEQEMPDKWLTELAVAGTPEDCRAAIQELVEAGADSVVLVPVEDDLQSLESFITTLLPILD